MTRHIIMTFWCSSQSTYVVSFMAFCYLNCVALIEQNLWNISAKYTNTFLDQFHYLVILARWVRWQLTCTSVPKTLVFWKPQCLEEKYFATKWIICVNFDNRNNFDFVLSDCWLFCEVGVSYVSLSKLGYVANILWYNNHIKVV